MKPSGIGGMAAIEGVMMRNKDEYAIAVRKPDNEIIIEKTEHKSFSDKVKLFKLPIFRGMLSFVDSMVIGLKVISFSSSFIEEEEKDQKENKEESGKVSALLMFFAVLVSLVVSISLFMVLPVLISSFFTRWIESIFLLSLMEGILRLLIFIGYIILASRMTEIKRMFMYHGAEHKTINCLENGFELNLENVKWQSKTHKRCGTSFMLFVMLISLVLFVIIRPETLLWRILSRILLVPIIAGVSYEFIRLAGKTNNPVMNILSKPGIWMQALTTKEPDDDMIEVAIQSVDAVFNWREFLAEVTETVKDEADITDDTKKSKRVKKDSSIKDKESAKKEYAAANEILIASPKIDYEEEDDEILRALDKYLDFDEEK
ncbi:MAG: DUF1385 domain-containing protein [Clostridiales bacterium]|nr:DUF1385 domain-containing protein [Clostridiales bacterium]